MNEPVTIGTAITTLVTAAIAVLIGFEVVEWTDTQIAAVMGIVAALLGTVGVVTRNVAWGPVSHDKAVREAGGDHSTPV